jgi:hypothetical protein
MKLARKACILDIIEDVSTKIWDTIIHYNVIIELVSASFCKAISCCMMRLAARAQSLSFGSKSMVESRTEGCSIITTFEKPKTSESSGFVPLRRPPFVIHIIEAAFLSRFCMADIAMAVIRDRIGPSNSTSIMTYEPFFMCDGEFARAQHSV